MISLKNDPDFFDLNHPPAAYMPPIGFAKKPPKYKSPPKKTKEPSPKPSEVVSDYDDYFEPYTQPPQNKVARWQ